MSNNRLLLLQTYSGLHAGQPEAPDRLRRDPETGRPVLRSETILGSLRKQMRDQLYANYQAESDWKQAAAQDPGLLALFGTPEAPGALSASHGHLLLLPVRSLHGVFTWVISPGGLAALAQNLAMLDLNPLPELPNLHPFDVLCQADHAGLLEGNHLLLEELSFQRRGEAPAVFEWLSQEGLLGGHQIKEQLPQRLALISDTAFDHFMRYALVPLMRSPSKQRGTPRLQHIEMLPTESLLYSVLSLDESQDWQHSAGRLPGHVYIGSHLTTGHGLCAVSLISPKEAA